MVKNSGKGGKKHKKCKNSINNVKELVFKDTEQEYAIVTKKLGNCRFIVTCFDKKDRLGILRGKMRGRNYINTGDLILICLRDFEDGKADIVHKYTSTEAKRLKQAGQIPEDTKISENDEFDNDDGVTFNDSDDELIGDNPNMNKVVNNKTSEESEDSIDIDDL